MTRRRLAEPLSRLPDVRDGLTRLERVTLHALAEAQREQPGERVSSALLYGRVLAYVSVSPAEFQAVLGRLVARARPDPPSRKRGVQVRQANGGRSSFDAMAERNITAQDFEPTITEKGITVLDFWASWCGPCRSFAPIFAAAAERHPDVTWGKIDTEAEQQLAGSLAIRSIPTLMVFREGVLLLRHSGALPGQALDEIVAKARQLDMDAVRAEIASQSNEGDGEVAEGAAEGEED